MKKMLKIYVRPIQGCLYSIYDLYRFYRTSGWRENYCDKSIRNYAIVKIYHALEKSLAFEIRNKTSGVNHCSSLYNIIKNTDSKKEELGFHDRVAINVLDKFIKQIEGIEKNKFNKLIKSRAESIIAAGGVKAYKAIDYDDGILINPEKFFESRYSLRKFSKREIDESDLRRAIKLAIAAPSVCNRQPWHIYEARDKEKIKKILELQNGNKGFTQEINHLLVITADLKAFFTPKERNQLWIDGGIFTMSLIMSFHSIGISSCCLNWSQNVVNDIRLRKRIPILDHHSVVMLLAIGYPNENNTVCESPRCRVDEFLTKI